VTALRLGTRASALARTQSQAVADAITATTGAEVELVSISTEGDRSAAAIPELGGTGVFVTAIRAALVEGTVDLAVHSYKDLPTASAPGLILAAVPQREDPRDALVARDGLTLGELPPGSTVGTGAPRRVAQLRALGLGLEIVPIRGNVDTRMGRVGAGDLDAVVLARAGLARLGRLAEITETLDPLQVLPAPAQGALAASNTRPPAAASPPSGARWPPSRPAAAPRSPPTPRSPTATTAPFCSSAPRSPPSTAVTACVARSPAPSPMPPLSVGRSPPTCSSVAPAP
jgi:hydroxymethylbilane synthase